jgi:hypothetical protein
MTLSVRLNIGVCCKAEVSHIVCTTERNCKLMQLFYSDADERDTNAAVRADITKLISNGLRQFSCFISALTDVL